MELKYGYTTQVMGKTVGSNRTFMELKSLCTSQKINVWAF